MHPLITQDHVDTFQRDGVVLIKGLFADHVDTLRAGIERNMNEPGPYAAENLKEGEGGRFFDDYCNWTRIPEFEEAIKASPAAEVAAELMKSKTRKREVVQARQIAMFYAKNMTKASLATIGAQCGGKDHATVLHAYRTVNNLIETDKQFRGYIADLDKKIKLS